MKFYHSQMQKLKIEQTLQESESFRSCFTKNITSEFFSEIDRIVNGTIPQHIVLFIYGDTGSLKSSSAQEIAKLIDPKFTEKNVVFDDYDLLDLSKQSIPGQIFVRDESPKSVGHGSGRIAFNIQILQEALRKRRNSLIFIRPTFEMIPTAHYWLRTIDHTDDMKFARLGVQNPLTSKFMGSIIIPISIGNETWKKYEIQKDAFIERIAKQDTKTTNYDKMAKEVMKDKRFPKVRTKSELKLLVVQVHGNLTVTEQKFVYTAVLQKVEHL